MPCGNHLNRALNINISVIIKHRLGFGFWLSDWYYATFDGLKFSLIAIDQADTRNE